MEHYIPHYDITVFHQTISSMQQGRVLEMSNWMPGLHDEVPQMMGRIMPHVNPRWNTDIIF